MHRPFLLRQHDRSCALIVTLIYACTIASGEPRPADLIDDLRWFPLSDPPNLAFDIISDAIAALQRKLSV